MLGVNDMPQIKLSDVGNRIKTQRRYLGYTQQKVYDELDISQNHYSRIENGHIGMSFDILIKLSEILGLSIDYILTGRLNNQSCPDFVAKYKSLSEKQKRYIISQIDLLKQSGLE